MRLVLHLPASKTSTIVDVNTKDFIISPPHWFVYLMCRKMYTKTRDCDSCGVKKLIIIKNRKQLCSNVRFTDQRDQGCGIKQSAGAFNYSGDYSYFCGT